MSDPFVLRPARRDDFDAVLALQIACDISETGRPDSVAEDLQADWAAPGFNLDTDAWVADNPGGGLAGFGVVHREGESAEFTGDFWVRPAAAAGSAPAILGPRLLNRIEARAKELAAESGHTGRATLGVFCNSISRLKQGCLEGGRFKVARAFYRMAIDLSAGAPTPIRPEGVSLRSFAPKADARAVWTLVEAAFKDHFRHVPRSFAAWKKLHMHHPAFDAGLWLLAETTGGAPVSGRGGARKAVTGAASPPLVVGALLARNYDELGWISHLAVARTARNRGIGNALLRASFNEFHRRGQFNVQLGVDAQNASAAPRLYERAGMHGFQRWELYQKKI